ncbi:hypothetical protein [Micromonospora sp. NPDC047730]|uniref:hypothetical protein n=1 Tax=Micromonospora sp. NPDC047730 TaxID=3364253 RepID=UPI0037213F61
MLHRRGRLWPALAVRGSGDLGEHGAQEARVEIREAVAAQVGDEDVVDVTGVVETGGEADLRAGVEPVPQPPFDCPAVGGAVGFGGAQPFLPRPSGGGLRRVAAAAYPLGAAEEVGRRAVEVPGAVAVFAEPWAGLLQPSAIEAASAPLEDHT